MATNVTMPKLGLTMETGKIAEWKVTEGGMTSKGEVLLIVETEKITYEVESPESGLLHIIVPQDGEVPVAEVIGIIASDKAEYDKIAAGGISSAVSAPVQQAPAEHAQKTVAQGPRALSGNPGERIKSSPLARRLAAESGIEISMILGTGPDGRIVKKDVLAFNEEKKVRITPVAEKMACEGGIDTSTIAGTGPGGKITKDDIEKYIVDRNASSAEKKVKAASQAVSAHGEGDRLVKNTGMRKVIARKMLQSCNEAAMTYMSNSVDATAIQDFRNQLLPLSEKKYKVRVTITDFVMKITAAAIRQHPVINTRWAGDSVLWLQDINLGMAMAIKDGLVVPVIRNTDKKSIIEIAKDRVALIDKGREGKLLPDDMSGGTFTVSALGMFGTEFFTAIINQPENAILAVGAIIDKPVVINKQIVIRPVMNVTLSYDHRTIDGAEAGQFLRTLKDFMENPMMILAM